MDKYEYKVRADEIKALIAEGEYAKAAEIADTIDWRRVKSVMMLCTISDLYKINRRYEDSKNILLLAYEKHPGGRLIVYSLCELSIKLEEYVQAIEYYKEFVQLAPKDSGRYVLQYKLYEAQEVSLEERIAVLEELKNKEYREKWMYELAYLYHRVGLETKCVEECDEMYLWFGEGRYVMKALELKQLHQPLTEDQKRGYAKMKQDIMGVSVPVGDGADIKQEAMEASVEEEDNEFSREVTVLTDPTQKMPRKEELDDIQVKTVDVSQYNTINLQKELAESMREFLENNQTVEIPAEQVADALGETKVIGPVSGDEMEEVVAEPAPSEEEVSEEGLSETETFEETAFAAAEEEMPKKRSITEEIFFGDTSEVTVEDVLLELEEQDAKAQEESAAASETVTASAVPGAAMTGAAMASAAAAGMTALGGNSAMINTGVIRAFNKPSGYDNILSQDSDGQISLVVPEQEKVEKQITGQLSIDDIMAEWEKIKKENEQKRMADIRERVQQHTGSLFADFDESAKTGLLEELEKSMAEEDKPRVIKVSDIEKLDAEAALAAGLTEEIPVAEVAEEAESEVVEAIGEAVEEAEPEAIGEAVEETEPEAIGEAVEETEPEAIGETVEETEPEAAEEPAEEAEPEEAEEAVEETEPEAAEESVEETEPEAAEETVEETEPEAAEDTVEEVSEAEEEPAAEEKAEAGGKYRARELTKQESELFAPFIHHRRTRRQIADAIDHISMASYTGNVIITGEESTGNLGLAKLLVKEVQMSDDNFSGKVAKISASTLNTKDVAATLDKLEGGALIIEGVAELSAEVVSSLLKEMNQEDKGLIILMEDRKPRMNEFLAKNEEMQTLFNLRVDVEALDDQTLVKYAKKYAYEQEYVIDELAVLALHKRIADMQTSDHEVTMAEIEELVDEAIYYADKKTPKHFFDVLVGKRYDEEDMIILREADFMHD